MNTEGKGLGTGLLYLIATPIGNLSDLSLRAKDTLALCDLIACEDTRVTAKLLAHIGVKVPMTSYREENERRKAPELADRIECGEKIGLVSDAGFPAISDPGFRLVRECRRRKFPVVPIPGPNAAITALAVSGLPTDKFLYLGFLPNKSAGRCKVFEQWKCFPGSLLIYESKYRVAKTLADMENVFGPDRNMCIAREITKIHETFVIGKISDLKTSFAEKSGKGEFVLVVGPEGYVL
ncbi:MAG: 16S rRNA (cytidine(1402)-2'-O)-methyltransferase [Verrucomicrobia bacterium]|nr:16S rRNA (cytidine(1402)-2'-O)-methyltransferase [Verrucomicrobiota bacterium]